MPNRFIKESCLTSHTLNKISDGAERLFWRLVVVADDFGRFHADPDVMLARCFPKKIRDIPSLTIMQWIDELRLSEAIALYKVKDTLYGFFLNWDDHQKRRAENSKFPAPTEETYCEQLLTDSSKCVRISYSYSYSKTYNDIRSKKDGFQKFWEVYPKKKSKGQAEKAWIALKPDQQLHNRIYDALEQAKTSEEWIKDGGRFIPYPATWLRAKGWEDECPDKPKMQDWKSRL